MLVELLLLSLLLLLLKKFMFKSRAQKLYDKIPGPKPYPIFGNLLEFNYPKEEITDTYRKLVTKYGPVCLFWMGPEPIVLISNHADAEGVLCVSKVIDKAKFFNVLFPWIGKGLFTSGGDEWKKQRKILTPAFNIAILQAYVPVFGRNSRLLTDHLAKMEGKDFDFYPIAARYSLDVICETAMGLQTNSQVEDSGVHHAIDEMTNIVAHRNFSLLQRSILFPLTPTGKRHNYLLSYLHGVTENMIKTQREKQSTAHKEPGLLDANSATKEGKGLFLDYLLEYDKDGTIMPDRELRNQVDTFLVAGYDTSQATITFTLYNLSQNQEAQDRVYEELQSIFGNSDRLPTYQDLQDMRYLDMAIRESLRIHWVGRFLGRYTTEEITLRSGYTIPKNTTLILLTEVMNHDPKVWPDPLKFDPGRFFTEEARANFLTNFGAGPRICIGYKFAMLSVKSVISSVVRRFRLIPSDIPLDLRCDIVLRSATGVNLRVETRRKS